jgi:hypothetical protein
MPSRHPDDPFLAWLGFFSGDQEIATRAYRRAPVIVSVGDRGTFKVFAGDSLQLGAMRDDCVVTGCALFDQEIGGTPISNINPIK